MRVYGEPEGKHIPSPFSVLCPLLAGINSVQPGVRVSENGLHHVREGVPDSGHQCRDQQGTTPAIVSF